MRRYVTTAASLFRVELRGLLPMAAGLLAFALVSLMATRALFDVGLPIEGTPHGALVLALTMVALLPLTAEALEADWRRGIARLYQAAPVGKVQVLGAKAAAVAAHGVGIFLAVMLVDGAAGPLLTSAERAADDSISVLFSWPDLPAATVVVGWIGMTVTAVVATLCRHALAATLAGALVATLPALIGLMSGGAGMLYWLAPYRFGGTVPLQVALVLFFLTAALIAAAYALRGRPAASPWRRLVRATASITGVVMSLMGMQCAIYLFAATPEFDDPEATITSHASISPDGRQVILETYHRSSNPYSIRGSWLLDTKTYAVTPLPNPFKSTHPWTFFLRMSFSEWWAFDGRGVLVAAETAWTQGEGRSEAVLMDPATGEAEPIEWSELNRINEHGGWTFEPIREEGSVNSYVAMAEGGGRYRLPAVWRPRVPKAAPHLLFYTNKDHEIRRLDTHSGDDVCVIAWKSRESFFPSPKGEWLVIAGSKRARTLVEVATGRTLEDIPTLRAIDGEYPIVHQSQRPTKRWRLIGIDKEKPLDLARSASWLKPLPDGRWIGGTYAGGLWIFGADGALLREIHAQRRDEEP